MKGIALALLCVLAVAVESASARGTSPSLRVVAFKPVTVTGARFHAGERVRVTVAADGVTRVRVVRATAVGSFRVVFSVFVARDPCDVRAGAVGSSGAKAIWKMSERMCSIERPERFAPG